MKVSVIIPSFNEEQNIVECITSLGQQTKPHELIIVDDCSTDDTVATLKRLHFLNSKLVLLQQNHLGPGAARNMGAKQSTGEILVFVDADMSFAPDFLEELVGPIEDARTKGTFTRIEYVKNWDNVWARCWNYNQGIRINIRIPQNYPNTSPVFRAILKSEFIRVGGFEHHAGWTDDWSLSQKLNYKATETPAVCFHINPKTLIEVFIQARWVGKNTFMSRNILTIFMSLIKFSFPVSFSVGICKAIIYRQPKFLFFKLIHDLGIYLGLTSALSGGHRNK